ncbi:hypothetical protein QTI17_33005 [Variovorax sp. J31P179]|uniref:hypothetical protein n=1 Tax=Variovorax sp. J31P179 TaxID=3053508 RepID=UPI00257762CC|nr:hypothetical protein [Variovorax sp. J31P179]MDM0085421.1 hypothetical protein [Variovorax sp. J31P179]
MLKMWRTFIWSFGSLILAVAGMSAYGHGIAEPRHGGVVQSANDITFEFVSLPEGAVIYVFDHDEEYGAHQMTGKLTVLRSEGTKLEADLRFSGGNRLSTTGLVLARGDRVVATISEPGNAVLVRFTVK